MEKEISNHHYQCPLCGAVDGLSFYEKHDAEADYDIPRWEIIKIRYHSISFHCRTCNTSMEIRTQNLSGFDSLFRQTHKNKTK